MMIPAMREGDASTLATAAWWAEVEPERLAQSISLAPDPFQITVEDVSVWSVSTYAWAREVLRNTDVFRSGGGALLTSVDGDAASGKMLAISDAPHHTHLRRVLAPLFTPEAADALRSRIVSHLESTVLPLIGSGSFDFVSMIADPVPARVSGELVGIPHPDIAAFQRHVYDSAVGDERERQAAYAEALQYLFDLIDEKRAGNRDAIELLLAAGLPTVEVALNALNVAAAGAEVVRLAAAGAVAQIATADHVQAAFRKDGVSDQLLDEVLRFTTPGTHMMRTVARPVVIGEIQIAAGERIAVWLPFANRDCLVFPCPDQFLPDRPAHPRHIAFGLGHHFCIGAVLGRVQLELIFTALLDNSSALNIGDGEVRRLASLALWGYESLPISLDA
jgi:cytochrome P450